MKMKMGGVLAVVRWERVSSGKLSTECILGTWLQDKIAGVHDPHKSLPMVLQTAVEAAALKIGVDVGGNAKL
jgi:hypothetical protein